MKLIMLGISLFIANLSISGEIIKKEMSATGLVVMYSLKKRNVVECTAFDKNKKKIAKSMNSVKGGVAKITIPLPDEYKNKFSKIGLVSCKKL